METDKRRDTPKATKIRDYNVKVWISGVRRVLRDPRVLRGACVPRAIGSEIKNYSQSTKGKLQIG